MTTPLKGRMWWLIWDNPAHNIKGLLGICGKCVAGKWARYQCSKLSQKSNHSLCLACQNINIKSKKNFKKDPGTHAKLSSSGRRTGSNLEHCKYISISRVHNVASGVMISSFSVPSSVHTDDTAYPVRYGLQLLSMYQWLSARLQYLQCVSIGDTATLH